MVEPVTMAIAAATISGGSKIIGGVLAAARARARGEYLAKQAEEQRKLYARQFNRRLEQEFGKAIQTGGRGIESSGTILTEAYNEAFDLILQREAVKQRLSQQASQARVTGSIQSQAALGSGFGGALGTAVEAGQEYGKSKPGPRENNTGGDK
jgi:hypothetical protein